MYEYKICIKIISSLRAFRRARASEKEHRMDDSHRGMEASHVPATAGAIRAADDVVRA